MDGYDPAGSRLQSVRSWANYFCLGAVSKAYSAVDMHAHRRLRRWLCDKHHERRPGYKRFPDGLCIWCMVYCSYTPYCDPLVAESVSLFREPDAGNLPVLFDEREEETERKRRETGKA
jgi:hypothetical protein